ncbi:RNA polymerase sigma factor [Actinoplanes couchii]|uniref:RNA polymerase sigma24 factor n=1 Tax=Actinoplanes couchii TaxID=403638 RepID=A0ABQ3XGA5_9ACTN|nr:RNA polymerase sigma24 factor [Actinoplanes couchii]
MDHLQEESDRREAVVFPGVRESLDAVDEEELVRRTAAGDRRAFDELYRRTSPMLAVRLRRRCSDADVVADVLQETYLSVWRAAGSFAGAAAQGSALGWLWTIAANRLVDAFRRRARQEQVPPVPVAETVAPAAEDEVMAGRVGQDLEQALLRLPLEVRQVLRAMVLDGLSARDTAVLLNVPEGTVKSRARRARIALREALS